MTEKEQSTYRLTDMAADMRHIVLLPRDRYWQWVAATQPYVLNFAANLTPDPRTAGEHFYPGQTITVVAAPEGYPLQGDIQSWFEQHYPEASLDLIDVEEPSELATIFADRISRGDRFGSPSSHAPLFKSDWFADAAIRLHWPTDYALITQPFGANPEIYAELGLPGHDGVDIRAPRGSNVYACADGEVYDVSAGENDHRFGRRVHLRHEHGYETVYAHLSSVKVKQGERVKAGKVIGKAGATGNSAGAHLHLTLIRNAATAGGYTHFPKDVLDPTPFLIFPDKEANSAAYPWSAGRCLAGVNARPDGAFSETDFRVLEQSGMEAIKLALATSQDDIARLKQRNPGIFLMTQAHKAFERSAMDAKAWVTALRPHLARHYAAGVRYFDLYRAPNLYREGCYQVWESGREFARWWLDAVSLLRDEFPEGRFGFPALMPGSHIDGQRMDATSFLSGCEEAVDSADFLAVMAYWADEKEMGSESGGAFYQLMRRQYPDELIFVTEFANVNDLTSPQVKGRQYRQFYESLRPTAGIGAAFAQILSSPGPYQRLAWRSEEGLISDLVAELTSQSA